MSNGDDDEENDSHLDEKDDDEGFDTSEELDCHSIDDNKNHYLFSMRFVNSSGSSVVDKIKDDGQFIKFPSKRFWGEYYSSYQDTISHVNCFVCSRSTLFSDRLAFEDEGSFLC